MLSFRWAASCLIFLPACFWDIRARLACVFAASGSVFSPKCAVVGLRAYPHFLSALLSVHRKGHSCCQLGLGPSRKDPLRLIHSLHVP